MLAYLPNSAGFETSGFVCLFVCLNSDTAVSEIGTALWHLWIGAHTEHMYRGRVECQIDIRIVSLLCAIHDETNT